MKFGNVVRLIADNSELNDAKAYRAMLEYYGQDTQLVVLRNEADLKRAFREKSDRIYLTILFCHGWGNPGEGGLLHWELQRPINTCDWENIDYLMTPQNVRDMVTTGHGILINKAAWSAKPAFADAFLGAGYSCYIAPQAESDMYSAYQFISAMLGYLLYEVRDRQKERLSINEAFERAQTLDQLPDGANGFRLFGHHIEQIGELDRQIRDPLLSIIGVADAGNVPRQN